MKREACCERATRTPIRENTTCRTHAKSAVLPSPTIKPAEERKMNTQSGVVNSCPSGGIDVGLTDVPETMLWTLHNRVSEAKLGDDGWFHDPKSLEIYSKIDYDYERSFG